MSQQDFIGGLNTQCMHGDLTTRNILLNKTHTVAKIGDLGLSKTLQASITGGPSPLPPRKCCSTCAATKRCPANPGLAADGFAVAGALSCLHIIKRGAVILGAPCSVLHCCATCDDRSP